MVPDSTRPGSDASITAIGFALTAYLVGVERRFMTRREAVDRTLTTFRFFWNSPQGEEPDATGHRGFYYHFLHMDTGRRAGESELSTIDSTFLLAGMLSVPALQHFNDAYPEMTSEYGFKCSFNPTFTAGNQTRRGWISKGYYGLDQGPIVMMIENHRTEFLWNLMRRCPYLLSFLRAVL